MSIIFKFVALLKTHTMKFALFISTLFLLASCAEQKKDNTFSIVIDIEEGLNNVTDLKVSDFGKTIRYIPLETTDSCLIGNKPIVKVLKNYIVIESNRNCYLFDKKDGRFITTVGHYGQDPEAYGSHNSYTDENEDFLYFNRQPDNLVKYDMTGKFSGKITFPIHPGLASHYLITDNEIITHHSGMNPSENFTLAFHDKTGALKDTTNLLIPASEVIISDNIAGINVLQGNDVFGCLGNTGIIILDYKNDNKQIISLNTATLWNNNGNVRFKEFFIDTIYNVNEGTFTPYIAFNTGKWSWPADERVSKKNNDKRVFISYVSENNTFVFFQCITGLYTDDAIVYNGLYNKKTGKTKLGKNFNDVHDDLSGFIPFKPVTMSTSGEFVSIIDAFTISEWVEKNPGAKNNDKLNFLKDFDEDMNPVVILIEPS